MHDVDDEDGDVAEGGAAVPQVREGLVAGCVDDEQAGQLYVVELERREKVAHSRCWTLLKIGNKANIPPTII